MKKYLIIILVVVCPLICMGQYNTMLDLGSKRELFVDDYLIGSLNNLSLKLHEPVFRDVSFKLDQPWEGTFSTNATILYENGKYRLFYRAGPRRDEKGGYTNAFTCVAFSDDGIHWTKPKLGKFEFNGSKENNIIPGGLFPMIDNRPGVPAEERYKGFAHPYDASGAIDVLGGLDAYSSPDGYVWKKMSDKPLFGRLEQYYHAYDTQNIPLWSEAENCYVAYIRVTEWGSRYIARSTSKDFLNWESVATMVVIHKDRVNRISPTAPFEQFYTNQTSVYFRAPHIYIATPARFMEGRRVLTDEQAKDAGIDKDYIYDCSDVVLLTSRGGNRYDQTFLETFIRPGIGYSNWTSRNNFAVCNIVPTGETEMSIYVNANYATPNCEIRRYTLRLDGFASLHAPYKGGTFVSKPLTFSGKKLSLNFSTSAAGGLKVQLEQVDGTPYPGFALDDCVEIIGDEIARNVLWKNGSDVSALAGKIVRIRIVMKDAELYSLKFDE